MNSLTNECDPAELSNHTLLVHQSRCFDTSFSNVTRNVALLYPMYLTVLQKATSSTLVIRRPLQSGSKRSSFESPVQLSDLCDIDDDGTYTGWLPNPSLMGTATQVNQFIHSDAVWGQNTPAVHN